MPDLLKAADLALVRSVRASRLHHTLDHAEGARIQRALVELGVIDARSYRTGTRGLWISRLVIEWYGPTQILHSVDGEGECPQSSMREATWQVARYYADQAKQLVQRADSREGRAA